MTNKSKAQTITDLATSLVAKELESGSAESPADLLNALHSVAKLLETKAGSNQEITALAKQVQELVSTKVTK